jgi:hypothetical protein
MAEKLSLVLEVDDTSGLLTIKKLGDAVDDTTGKINKMGKSLEFIKWDAITSLIGKAEGAFKKLMDTAMKGAEIVQTEKTFYALANAAGVSGASMLDSMKKASQGTISNLDLMQGAIEGLRGHLSPDAVEKLTEASLTFAAAAGSTVKDAFQALMTVIETGRMRQLAGLGENFRMVNVAMTNYATALGKNSAEEMSATQRAEALFSILGQLAKGLEGANVKLDEHFIAIQQAKASWANFTDFLYKVALGAWSGISAAFLRGKAIIQEVLGGLLVAVKMVDSALVAMGFKSMQGELDQAKKTSDELFAQAEKNNALAASLEKGASGIFAPPLDIAGRGVLPPSLPGKNALKEQDKVIKAAWKERLATINEQQVEEMDMQKIALEKELDALRISLNEQQNLLKISEAQNELLYEKGYLADVDYINRKYDLSKKALTEEIANIEAQKTAVAEASKTMLTTVETFYQERVAAIRTTFAEEMKMWSANVDKQKELTSIMNADLANAGKKLEDDKAKITTEGEKKLTDLTIAQANKRVDVVLGETKREAELYKNMEKDIGPAMSEIGNSFISAIGSITDGSKKARDAFRDMAMSIIKYLEQMIMRLMIFGNLQGQYKSSSTGEGGIAGFLGSLIHSIAGGGTSTAGVSSSMEGANLVGGFDLGDVLAFFAREGGVSGPMLSHYPLRSYAEGGIASSPQIGIFGEGGGGEAFVPLRGGKIPIEGGGGSIQHYHYYHIMAMDSKSIDETLSRNPSAIMRILNKDKRLDGTTAKGTR